MSEKTLASLFIAICLLFSRCGDPYERKDQIFVLPQVLNSDFKDGSKIIRDTIEYVSEVFPLVVGKYKFSRELDLGVAIQDTTFENDLFFSPTWSGLTDSLDISGFEIFPDYNTTVYYRERYNMDTSFYEYYPVYLVNSTKNDKLFLGKDSHVFAIQEAQYKTKYRNRWYAIEGAGFDFCGNGTWGMIVHPREFMMFLMRKYQGDYLTKIRVRFRNGESLYVSTAFNGMIDERQFLIEEESYLDKALEDYGDCGFSGLFHGAIPKWEPK